MKHLTLPALLCAAALLLTACAQPAASSQTPSSSAAAPASSAAASESPSARTIAQVFAEYMQTSGSASDISGTRVDIQSVLPVTDGIAFQTASGFYRAYILKSEYDKLCTADNPDGWQQSNYMGIPWRARATVLTDDLVVYRTEPTFALYPDHGDRPDINFDTAITDMGDYDANILRLLLLVHFGVCSDMTFTLSGNEPVCDGYGAFFDGELIKNLYTEAGWEQVVHLHEQDEFVADPYIVEQDGKVGSGSGMQLGTHVGISDLQITHVSDTKRVYRFTSEWQMFAGADIAPGFTLEITAVRQRTKADEKLSNWLWKIDGFQFTKTPLNEQLSNY